MPPALPASMPTVSTPNPVITRSVASQRAPAADGPGVCGPFSSALRKAASSVARALQPLRSSTHAPSGNLPCSASQASKWSGSRRKSLSSATCSVTSTTAAGPINRSRPIRSTVDPFLPVAQCAGASKCVPVCSPVWMLCQRHIGPASSKSLTSSRLRWMVLVNGGGSRRTGVAGDSGAVRSIASIDPELSPDSSDESMPMITNVLRSWSLLEQRAQHVLHDAAVAVVLGFPWSIDTDDRVKGLLGRGHRHRPRGGARVQLFNAGDHKRLFARQAQGFGVLPFRELERQHAHPDQVRAVNPLIRFRDHRLGTE